MSARSLKRDHARRLRRTGLGATAALGAFALVPVAAAQADNFVVTTNNDAAVNPCVAGSCATLRDAVAAANGTAVDDTITFQAGVTGTIRLNQTPAQLTISDDHAVTINGPGAGVLAVSGDKTNNGPSADDSRIFYLADNPPADSLTTISGLTLTGGYAATLGGGAIYGDSNTTNTYSRLALNNAVVTGNRAVGGTDGGGVYTKGSANVTNSVISGNHADTPGGDDGGIIAKKYLGIHGSTVSGNTAAEGAGGIGHTGKYDFALTDSVVSGNTAQNGGGLNIAPNNSKYSDFKITNSTIKGNTATGSAGGGVLVGRISGGSTLTISHSTISGNHGTGPATQGGGISFSSPVYGDFEAVDSTISGNTAIKGGGVSIGFHNGQPEAGPKASLEFDNSTIAGNSASAGGGGIYLADYDPNFASTPPFKSATIPLNSTIVADNGGFDVDRADDSSGGGFDLSFSLVETPSGDSPLSQAPGGSGIVGVDPQLGPLASNGGPTETHLPSATSPVIDKGVAPVRLTTDQRGDPRTIDLSEANAARGDGTDIGAVERSTGATPPGATCVAATKKKKKKGKHAATEAKKKKHKSKTCKKKKKKHKKHKH
jgi:hypothetical protein